MSATTVASLFLALFCLRSIAAGQKNVDIVVLKYEGLGYSETVPVKEKYYFFSFCLCSQKTPDPERSASCNCASDVRGKKASDSIPRALFSASCIHNSNPLKCLTTGFKSVQDDRRLLYVKVDIDSRTLTSPSWQVIPNNPQKTSSKITAYTRSGDIRLDYVVFSSKNKEALSQKSKRFNRIKEFERKAKKTSLTWKKNRSGVGNTLHQIKDYLASKSNAQALKPLSADFDLDAFRSMITQSHNRYRSMHRVRPFEYDQTIERSAQQWADHLADQEACLKHDPMRRYGENLFFFGGSMFPPAEAIAESVTKSFYIEGNGYNYNGFRPVEIHRVGHFTQMIWKASERLGVGVAIRKSSGQKSGSCLPNKGLFLIYVVVKYDPPGNVLSRDQFLANILPPAGVQ
ncbi:hypothetical protein L596_003457 [Steinernema carpocapsae]|uniref:SCP domain-containing protein n=1 Tax=Steinernema carpocapsae TaxID=34508 RepID=A0A4U8USP2_STECR|nr:hypothetical protein L596_003457 [Steinernema carpocapsae]